MGRVPGPDEARPRGCSRRGPRGAPGTNRVETSQWPPLEPGGADRAVLTAAGALGAAERSGVAWKGLAASARSVRGAAPGSSRGDRLLPASALRVVAAGAALRVGRLRPPRRLPPAPARPPFAFAAFSFLNFRLIRFRRGPGPLHSAASAARPRSASRSRPWPPQAGLSRAADCERPCAPPHAPVRIRVALSCLLFGVTLGRSASALPVSGRACPGPISSVPCPALAFSHATGSPAELTVSFVAVGRRCSGSRLRMGSCSWL